MRLDIFLPFLRKTKKNAAAPSDGLLLRAAKRVLPKTLFADRVTGKPGLWRRVLKRVGPSWLSSPVRRTIQAICFVTFLVLFFYVCWPYSAQPAKIWPNWKPQSIEATGKAVLVTEQPIIQPVKTGMTLHVADESIADQQQRYVGGFRVLKSEPSRLEIEPVDVIAPDMLMQLTFSSGPWTLHEAPPGSWPSHYTDSLAAKEVLPADSILIIDPLVSLSTALAAKSWVWSLTFAGIILVIGVFIPRGFCGYICPLGTLIDLFDWVIGKRVTRFRVADDGWWVHIKYYLLLGTLIASMFGVLVSGYVAAIPVVTRGMLFLFEPLQTGSMRGWHQVAPMNAGHFVSIGLFFIVLGLGLFKPRFWCKYVCPSGAVFSLGNLFRVSERKVESTCINCNKCVEICPFDAIKPDFTTRTSDCTLCQTCGGVCPTQAIKFVERWNKVELKVENDPPTHETRLGRRGFLSLAAGTAAAVAGGVGITAVTKTFGANLHDPNAYLPVRPPGSVPEKEFLEMCIRCGECFKVCPSNVLQAMGFQQGLEGLWTPRVVADWAGCESSCNACGQVCPTGAIRALPLEEKKVARMGLAIVNEQTCLPYAGREACQLCVDECVAAGYDAIEFTRVGTEMDELGAPIEGSGFVAPVVLADKCVGCGLCQTRCYGINVVEKGLLEKSAIIIHAGSGNEDRLMRGSYLALRQGEQRLREQEQQKLLENSGGGDSYLPDFLN
jgi:ferredoxin